jgi:hypothetical protein
MGFTVWVSFLVASVITERVQRLMAVAEAKAAEAAGHALLLVHPGHVTQLCTDWRQRSQPPHLRLLSSSPHKPHDTTLSLAGETTQDFFLFFFEVGNKRIINNQ